MKQHKLDRPRLLAAGYLTLDMVVRDFAKRDYWHSAGGTCGNVSIFASALGVEVSLLGQLGMDQRARRIWHDMKLAGVDTLNVEHNSDLRTPGIVELIGGTAKGDHRFTHQCPLCGVRLPKQAVVSKARAASLATDIHHFDAYFFDRATSATISLAKAARDAGLLIMFEPPTIPRTSLAKNAAALSDIIKVSRRTSHGGLDWVSSLNTSARFIIETLGPAGTRFREVSSDAPGDWVKLPAFTPTRIRDTAGAGDWLTAGLLADLLLGRHTLSAESIVDSINYGQKLSAISIAFDGPSGALTELGATTIKRAANDIHSFPRQHNGCSCMTAGDQATVTRRDYCDLCLTECE